MLATNAFPYSADEPETVYAYGTRSFSIWDTAGNLIWDSGADLTQRVLDDPILGAGFQGQDGFDDETENWTGWEADTRSDDKGVEPEAVTIGEICGVQNAFIGFERQSAVAQYDLTDPTSPTFVRFITSANYRWEGSDAGDQTIDPTQAGDISPEGVIFLPADESPDGRPWLVAAHELSGSTAAWALPSTCDSVTSDASGATETTKASAGITSSSTSDAEETNSTTSSASPSDSAAETTNATAVPAANNTSSAAEANTGTELAHTGRSTGLLLLAGLLLTAAGTLMAYPRRETSPIHGDEL
ncbi:MAG: hypothetical protein H6512_06630 [Acidimicrobiia bacterium]|nr:hypothetical protein [Acidimicrobiia bacterium]